MAQIMAKLEAKVAGKELPTENALVAGSDKTELSPLDLGRVAELRVLLRQLASEKTPAHGGRPNPKMVEYLQRDIDVLLAHLGLENDPNRVEKLVEPHLDQASRRALHDLQVRADQKRRDEAAEALPDQGGTELHNHFLGIVSPEEFAAKAKEAADRKAIRAGDKVSKKSQWEILLDSIASMSVGKDGKAGEHAHKDADGNFVPRGQDHAKRGTSGDAIALAVLTKQVIEGNAPATLPDNTPKWLSAGAKKLGELKAALDKAESMGIKADLLAARKAYADQQALLAEEACRVALTDTDDTDFNSAYEIIDQQIKDNWGDESTDKLERKGAKSDATWAKEKNQAVNKKYENFARATVRALIRDGLL
jgi:hypothetical protein